VKKTIPLLLMSAAALSGCGAVGRLKAVGKVPPMTAIDQSPVDQVERSIGDSGSSQRRSPGMMAAQALPQAQAQAQAPQVQSSSLFRVGGGSFLGDQRAARVGDILTIRINIADKAQVGNNTSRSRTGSESAGVASLLGLQKLLPNSIDPGNLASTNSKSTSQGGGNIDRSETINMTMSAIVTSVLPNGNLVIRGRQEVRVNYELRELIVTGIVRPQDISRDNSIRHSQIAEARISYGGRGQLSDAQQARWGQQIYDALFPF
jgi:flagellar L-ring protein precursor FlgH